MILLFLACPPSPDSADSSSEPTRCIAEFNKVFPEDGSKGVYIRTPLQFYLTQPDPTAEIVTDIPGHLSLSEDQRIYSWIPDGPLKPEGDYTIGFRGCFGETSTRFQTSRAGEPLESSLVGRSYLLDLRAGRADSQVAELVAPYLVGFVRIDVLAQTETALTLRGSYSLLNDFAEPCELATQFAAFNDTPHFMSIPSDLPFPHLYHTQIAGTFLPDGSGIEGVQISGQWDVRDLDENGVNTDGNSPEELCGILSAVHLPCEVCRDGEPYCVNLSASLIPGVETASVTEPQKVCTSCDTAGISGMGWLLTGILAGLRRRRRS